VPAFKNFVMENPRDDFEGAAEFGPLWVGQKALYFHDMETVYIPLEDLDHIEMFLLPGACGKAPCCAQDACFTVSNGKSITIKVLDHKYVERAADYARKLNPLIRYTAK